GISTQSVAVGALDHAKGPDVVVLNQLNTGAGRLDVFLNQGGGVFPSTASSSTTPICSGGENARNVIVGEFDGDGNPDALVLCSFDVVVEHGNGMGGLTHTPTRHTNPHLANPLLFGDFDGNASELVYQGPDTGHALCLQPLSALVTSGTTPGPTCDSTTLDSQALAITRLGNGVQVALAFTGTKGSQSL